MISQLLCPLNGQINEICWLKNNIRKFGLFENAWQPCWKSDLRCWEERLTSISRRIKLNVIFVWAILKRNVDWSNLIDLILFNVKFLTSERKKSNQIKKMSRIFQFQSNNLRNPQIEKIELKLKFYFFWQVGQIMRKSFLGRVHTWIAQREKAVVMKWGARRLSKEDHKKQLQACRNVRYVVVRLSGWTNQF